MSMRYRGARIPSPASSFGLIRAQGQLVNEAVADHIVHTWRSHGHNDVKAAVVLRDQRPVVITNLIGGLPPSFFPNRKPRDVDVEAELFGVGARG